MAKLFLSFSIYDREFVERIERILEQGGHSVFVDRGDVASGASWADTVRAAIRDSDLFVIVASSMPPSKSDYVLNLELGAAWALGKPVVALVLPGAPAVVLPLPNTGFQVVPVDGRTDDEVAAAILSKIPEPATNAAS